MRRSSPSTASDFGGSKTGAETVIVGADLDMHVLSNSAIRRRSVVDEGGVEAVPIAGRLTLLPGCDCVIREASPPTWGSPGA